MVVTTNMGEFISNIRNERMNQFWNDTKKYQKFSPTTEEMVENAPPGTTHIHEDTCWHPTQNLSAQDRLDCNQYTEKEAIEYAKKHKYQTFTKRATARAHTYYFRDKVGTPSARTYAEVSNLQGCHSPGVTTWIIKY